MLIKCWINFTTTFSTNEDFSGEHFKWKATTCKLQMEVIILS